MIIKTILVDDNIQDLARLKAKFNNVKEPTYEVTCFNNPRDNKIFSTNTDLYVFDIDMPELSGFELAEKINQVSDQANVIFCSQHDDLVFQSFKLNFQYFIRKSHFDEDFNFAIRKINTLFLNTQKCYFYQSQEIQRSIPYQEIIAIEVNHNSSTIYLSNGDILEQRKTINSIEKELISNYFVRIHVSYIINLSYINQIKSNRVFLNNGLVFPISRSKINSTIESYRLFRIER